MPVPQTLVRTVGDVPVVIQAESQRQSLLVVQDARRALRTCSLQNWNTEADIFMTFIIFPVSSIATQQRPALCRWQVCGETGAACWGSSQHAKALVAILRGLSLNFDASLHNERSPTYQGHENLTDFFSYRRFRSLFSLVARNRLVGGGTLMHMSLFPPHLPLASEVSFTGNTLQLLWGPAFSTGFPVTLTVLIADTRKIHWRFGQPE